MSRIQVELPENAYRNLERVMREQGIRVRDQYTPKDCIDLSEVRVKCVKLPRDFVINTTDEEC